MFLLKHLYEHKHSQIRMLLKIAIDLYKITISKNEKGIIKKKYLPQKIKNDKKKKNF